MASSINSANIDGAYPIAGQDNDSQGFRTNFTNIKTNFDTAKSEIEDLQTNKANLNASNDFAGNVIADAEIKDIAQTVYAHGSVSGAVTIDYENGPVQTLTAAGNITLTFTNFPASGKFGEVTLIFTNMGSYTLTEPAAVKTPVEYANGNDSTYAGSYSSGANNVDIDKYFTVDAGTTIYKTVVGRDFQ